MLISKKPVIKVSVIKFYKYIYPFIKGVNEKNNHLTEITIFKKYDTDETGIYIIICTKDRNERQIAYAYILLTSRHSLRFLKLAFFIRNPSYKKID